MSFYKIIKKFGKTVYYCSYKFFLSCTKVKKNRLLAISMFGNNYGCNPRAITDYLLETQEDIEIFWIFKKKRIPDSIDKR
ncbi:MAG: CDP-glycerol glycerophosphotransferase family protein, partial [Bacteroidales bacterium]|nr:CDP-glycerol glycerophosphotransferase family protein [Bacteroidales bacterium]